MTSTGIRPHRSSGRARILGAACTIAAVLGLAACSASAGVQPLPSGDPPPSSAGTSSAAVNSEALRLVPVVWRVRDAAGESSDTWIRFDTQIDLVRPKGDVYADWTTQGDELLAAIGGWSMTLGSTQPTVPWLTSTVRFRPDGDGWVLTDASGRRTARLVRDGAPPPSTQSLHTVPTVNAFTRRLLTDAIPGATVGAIAPTAAIGIWGLPGIAEADGSVELKADGRWTARTSCEVLGLADGGYGAYRLLPSGLLLTTEGAIGGTGCDAPKRKPPADSAAVLRFPEVGSIAIDGTRMTVYSRTGVRLGTLTKKP